MGFLAMLYQRKNKSSCLFDHNNTVFVKRLVEMIKKCIVYLLHS